jgi:hypothetical protein
MAHFEAWNMFFQKQMEAKASQPFTENASKACLGRELQQNESIFNIKAQVSASGNVLVHTIQPPVDDVPHQQCSPPCQQSS